MVPVGKSVTKITTMDVTKRARNIGKPRINSIAGRMKYTKMTNIDVASRSSPLRLSLMAGLVGWVAPTPRDEAPSHYECHDQEPYRDHRLRNDEWNIGRQASLVICCKLSKHGPSENHKHDCRHQEDEFG